jgi:hypothetical protein
MCEVHCAAEMDRAAVQSGYSVTEGLQSADSGKDMDKSRPGWSGFEQRLEATDWSDGCSAQTCFDAKARSVRSWQALARLALVPLEFEGPW